MTALPETTVIGVVGAGTMGAGIAQIAARHGHPVRIYDTNLDSAQQAIITIDKRFDREVEKGRMTREEQTTALERITVVERLRYLSRAALVVEAAAERMDIKQEIFTELEESCKVETILASNTSSLSITGIAAGLEHPERFIGMHFFNPAPVMELVEVISGLDTSSAVAETVFDTALGWGKSPVHVTSSPGFIVNRVARPFYGEALRLLEETAADPATIDAILRDCGGFRMGPLELTDLIGQDVNYAVTGSVYNAFYQDPRYRPSLVQRALVEGRRLGRKTERGFYDYREGAEKPEARTEATCAPPQNLTLVGDLGPASALVDLIADSVIALEHRSDEGLPRLELPGGAWLALSDGRLATEWAAGCGRPVIFFDLARDYGTATRIALSPSDGCPADAISAAVGLFQAIGKDVSIIDDVPGLVLLRTVAMLANEAAEVVHQGIATAEGVDTAMMKGVNYPAGPLAWADALGTPRVLAVIENLQTAYADPRYRPSPLLRRLAFTGASFL